MEALEAIKLAEASGNSSLVRSEIKRAAGSNHATPLRRKRAAWQFLLIDDRRTLEEIPLICPTATMCRQAPLAILVCGDGNLEKYPDFWVQDCSAATENILLAAHAPGPGGSMGESIP